MADTDEQEQPAGEEQEPTGEQTENEEEAELGDEQEASDTGDASASDELSNKVRALEEQLARSNADIERERENARLQQRFFEQLTQRPQQQQQEDPDAKLSPEMRELKKLLKPLFEDEIKRATEPMHKVAGSLWEQNDAVNFQLTLSKKHPDYLDGDNFDKVNQAVESVRRQAALNGQTVGRLDAFYYAQGIGMLNGLKKAAPKATVKQGQQNKAADAAQSQGGVKKTPNANTAEINRIREKAGRGDRLNPKERAQFKKYLESQGSF